MSYGPGLAPSLARLSGSCSIRLRAARNEAEAEISTARAAFSGQRLETRELSSQISFSPVCGEGFNFQDKERRSEAEGGEAYALVYGEGAGLLPREWGVTLFLSFLGP